MDNTVELYNEFLNLMESTGCHDDLINVTHEEPPANTFPLNLNLHLNINSYYDNLARSNYPNIDSKLYNICNGHDSDTLAPTVPKKPPYHKHNAIQPDGLHRNIYMVQEMEDPYDVYTDDELENVNEYESENENDDEHENSIVPGLFPKMNTNDDVQFMGFDKLPLLPSYISK